MVISTYLYILIYAAEAKGDCLFQIDVFFLSINISPHMSVQTLKKIK